ncbi:hypothetical protein V6Z11_A04G152500 [Gossypium hirsutum]
MNESASSFTTSCRGKDVTTRSPRNTELGGSTESESAECVVAMAEDHRATDTMMRTWRCRFQHTLQLRKTILLHLQHPFHSIPVRPAEAKLKVQALLQVSIP